jgi:hypothetical protein
VIIGYLYGILKEDYGSIKNPKQEKFTKGKEQM